MRALSSVYIISEPPPFVLALVATKEARPLTPRVLIQLFLHSPNTSFRRRVLSKKRIYFFPVSCNTSYHLLPGLNYSVFYQCIRYSQYFTNVLDIIVAFNSIIRKNRSKISSRHILGTMASFPLLPCGAHNVSFW